MSKSILANIDFIVKKKCDGAQRADFVADVTSALGPVGCANDIRMAVVALQTSTRCHIAPISDPTQAINTVVGRTFDTFRSQWVNAGRKKPKQIKHPTLALHLKDFEWLLKEGKVSQTIPGNERGQLDGTIFDIIGHGGRKHTRETDVTAQCVLVRQPGGYVLYLTKS